MDDEQRRSAAESREVSHVQNVFDLEIEVAHRRGEWERAIVAAEQRSLARPHKGLKPWPQLALWTLAYLRAVGTPRGSVTCWNVTGAQRAPTLEGGGATAT
jgi:hypothetical protein